MTALVEILTCTTSLLHQLGAEDLGCALPFAPSVVPRIPGYGESCNFIQELKSRKLRTSEAKLKGEHLDKYIPHMHGHFKIELEILEIHIRTYFLTLLGSVFARSLSRLSLLIVSMSASEEKCSLVQPLLDMLLLALAPRASNHGGNPGLSIYSQSISSSMARTAAA